MRQIQIEEDSDFRCIRGTIITLPIIGATMRMVWIWKFAPNTASVVYIQLVRDIDCRYFHALIKSNFT